MPSTSWPTNDELASVFVTPMLTCRWSMMMSASSATKNASNCAKKKKKRVAWSFAETEGWAGC